MIIKDHNVETLTIKENLNLLLLINCNINNVVIDKKTIKRLVIINCNINIIEQSVYHAFISMMLLCIKNSNINFIDFEFNDIYKISIKNSEIIKCDLSYTCCNKRFNKAELYNND